MPYHIKKPSQLDSSVDVYYMGEKDGQTHTVKENSTQIIQHI